MWLAASAGQLISFKMDLALRLADWDHYCEGGGSSYQSKSLWQWALRAHTFEITSQH